MLDEILLILIIPLLGGAFLLLETWRGGENGLKTRRRATMLLRLTGGAAVLVALLLLTLGVEGVINAEPAPRWAVARLLVFAGIAAAVGWVGWRATRLAGPTDRETAVGAGDRVDVASENAEVEAWEDLGWQRARLVVVLMVLLPVLPVVVVVMAIASVLSLDIWNLWPLGRQARVGQLLWTLALAHRANLDPAEEVEALAWSYSARHRGPLCRLADRLRDGTRLSNALAVERKLMSVSHVAEIRVAENTGRLAETLEELACQHSRALSHEVRSSPQAGVIVYLFSVTAVLLATVSYLWYFIVPKLKETFVDFNVELPPLTERLVNATDILVNCWYLVPIVLLPFGLLVVMAQLARSAAGLDNVPRICRGLPRMRWPTLFPVLARVVRAEQPIPELLRDVAGSSSDQSSIVAYERLAVALERGESLAEALVSERIVNPVEGQALATSVDLRHSGWLLEGMLRAFESRWRERFLWLAQLVQPIALLLLGGVVLFISLSVLLPLTRLIGEIR